MSGFKESVKQILSQVFGRADFADVLEDKWQYSDTFEGEVVSGELPTAAELQARRTRRPSAPPGPTQSMSAYTAEDVPQKISPRRRSAPPATEPMADSVPSPTEEDIAVAPDTAPSMPAVAPGGPDPLETANLLAQIAFDSPTGVYPESPAGYSTISGQVNSLADDAVGDVVAGARTTEVVSAARGQSGTSPAQPAPLLLTRDEPKAAPLLLKNKPASTASDTQRRNSWRDGHEDSVSDEAAPSVRSRRTSSATVIEEIEEHAPLSSYDYGVKAPPEAADLHRVGQAALMDSLQADLDRLGSHHEEVLVELLLDSLENPVIDLPPFPAAARRLLGNGDDGPEEDDVLDVVKSDPGLAGSVMKAANSPFYMGAAPVASLGSAVVRIGMREVRRVALAAAMAATFDVKGFEPLIEVSHTHSLTVATSAEAFARTFKVDPGVAFLSGLLHDAGELLTYRLLVRAYGSAPPSNAPWHGRLHFVRELGKKYHCYLGAMFIEPWDLPAELEASLVYHHHPYMAADEYEELASLIHVANATTDVALRHARSDLWHQYLNRLEQRRDQSGGTASGTAGIDGIELLRVGEIMEMLPPGFPRQRVHAIVRDILLRVAAGALSHTRDDATTITHC
jgi:HD-like signal output (HDOD) protein